MDGDNVDPMISIEINNDFVLLIKGFGQDPDMGVKTFVRNPSSLKLT